MIGNSTDWKDIKCGNAYTLALKNDGSLWSWGNNTHGQLGLGDSEPQTERCTPTRVSMTDDWSYISCGVAHNVALKKDGSLWAWGSNYYGQLGLGDRYDVNTPTLMSDDNTWCTVSCGKFHTMALKKDGTLWGCGSNGSGQLSIERGSGTLKQVGSDSDWSHILCGTYHTFALKKDGSLWAWGMNKVGQLGVGDTLDKGTPTQVTSHISDKWLKVQPHGLRTVGVLENGTIMEWGRCDVGDSLRINRPHILTKPTVVQSK